MTSYDQPYGSSDQQYQGYRSEGREPGARRKKLAGYLKAANELRQSYAQSYTQNWNIKDGAADSADDGTPGAFPDAAVVRSGDEEMVLFPSYARKHVKTKPKAQPGTIQEAPGTGRDYRDSAGAGDAEFWKQQWEKYEEDNAVVDVDVRGWLYCPHKGQLNRKHRVMVALARQLVGIAAPPTNSSKISPLTSATNSRETSPHRGKTEAKGSQYEEETVLKEAEAILRKGEAEADIAGRGGFSEAPSRDADTDSMYSAKSRSSSPAPKSRQHSEGLRLSHIHTSESSPNENGTTALHKRSTWPQPAKMSPAELAVANGHLMTRLKPFLANPLGNTPISAFFYNEKDSRQKTINTNSSGHFSVRASLDFVPTHVRILASEKLSATEPVKVTEPSGVSLISDIDDTIKHSAISSGAREIFRNAFIRDLSDLTIEGVKEWYRELADSGGIFEPVAERKKSTLDKLMRDFPERRFILVGDSGEADLEVYTDVVLDNPGRILGVFIRDVTTPVSKGFFDPSMGPLSGDRSVKRHLRNKSTDSLAQSKRFSRPSDTQGDDSDLEAAIAASLKDVEDQDRAARRAVFQNDTTLRRLAEGDQPHNRPTLPTRRPTAPPAPEAHKMEPPVGDLIDLSEDVLAARSSRSTFFPRSQTAQAPSSLLNASMRSEPGALSPPPPRPDKPVALRSRSAETTVTLAPHATLSPSSTSPPTSKVPPPRPRKPSTSVHRPATVPVAQTHYPADPSPLSQVQRHDSAARPPLPQRQTYRAVARQKLSHAYNALPSASSVLPYHLGQPKPASAHTQARSEGGEDLAASPRSMSTISTKSLDSLRNKDRERRSETSNSDAKQQQPPPPAPPPRRNLSSYPVAAAQYATNRLSGGMLTSAPTAQSTTSSNLNQSHRNGSDEWGSANGYGGGGGGPVNKKEEMWKRRWARAKTVLDEKGVVLRSWRVGGDVQEECLKLVKKALEDIEKGKDRVEEEKQKEERGRRR
ncbi:hypothetical protein LTR66_002495 [Elasticomyces elasticus]|nr:hypothetical protein LTR66_002495 [Elasticomyces elasticus]